MRDEKENNINIPERFVYRVEEVFKEYYSPLCYFASRFLNQSDNAEDLVQDLFASLLEKELSFQSSLHLKNFLYLSVRNACFNSIRKGNSKENYIAAGQNALKVEDSLIQNIIATEVYKELAEALVKLPGECRKVFEACYFEGLDNEKAAQKLGISVFTVKAQKARGKKILKENLKNLYPLIVLFFDSL